MQESGLHVISTLYTPSPQVNAKQCHDNKQMNMSYWYVQLIDSFYYGIVQLIYQIRQFLLQ